MTAAVIVGAGAFGTAIATAIGRSGQPVALYCRNSGQADEITRLKTNKKYAPNARLLPNISGSANYSAIWDAETIFLAFPSKNVRDFANQVSEFARPGAIIVNLIKGLDLEHLTFSALFEKVCPRQVYVTVKGPTFAKPLMAGEISCVTCASKSLEDAYRVADLFSAANLHFDYSDNPDAVDLVSALKNIYAILMGMISSLGVSENTLFWLISSVVKEIRDIFKYLEKDQSIIFNYCGLGDVLLTGLCDMSRNRTFGIMIGKNIPIHRDTGGFLMEGLKTIDFMHEIVPKEVAPFLYLLQDILLEKREASALLEFTPVMSRSNSMGGGSGDGARS